MTASVRNLSTKGLFPSNAANSRVNGKAAACTHFGGNAVPMFDVLEAPEKETRNEED